MMACCYHLDSHFLEELLLGMQEGPLSSNTRKIFICYSVHYFLVHTRTSVLQRRNFKKISTYPLEKRNDEQDDAVTIIYFGSLLVHFCYGAQFYI
mmetsp:Transcript_44148/g.79186  ORF Transcript_44148/g.79186 Transcript_44148/m.79186 type:complete len:95 (-) Transcript_44148:132-416(-)